MKKHLRTVRQRMTFVVVVACVIILLGVLVGQLISGGDLLAVLWVALFITGIATLIAILLRAIRWVDEGDES